LCLILKRALPENPNLKIVLMSATVDATKFLDYFSGPGVRVCRSPVVVGSRRFPTWPFFLDELQGGLLKVNSKVEQSIQRLCSRWEGRLDGKVEVNVQLFEITVAFVAALASPGVCFLIFLPGLSEIDQLHEAFLTGSSGPCQYAYHMLHSIVPHEVQKLALGPPPKGHAKIVLSTNIAESSVTIPDVRYVIDFGIARKLMLDEDRSMLSLCNTWCSKATCMQRRGRCGRLQEGTILYMFPRSLYDRMPEFASAEILNVPLETIYLKAKVLMSRLGGPQEVLEQLMDPPKMQRIQTAATNLRDVGALTGPYDAVAELGRIAVFMPTTIQLTKLVMLGWALGCACDAVVIAAAMSTQDVFIMATPQQCRNPADFPPYLAENYHVRMRHDHRQFSEPIMYRNLWLDWHKSPMPWRKWLERNHVSVTRMQQFNALVAEIAAKFLWAVPGAAGVGLERLAKVKRGQKLAPHEVRDMFVPDYRTLKFSLVAAFSPSFVQGEINTANKNASKIKNSGFADWKKVCLLASIKPEELRDDDALWEFCSMLGPVTGVKCGGASSALIECGDDPDWLWQGTEPSEPTVHQMPLVAQLLHQLARQPIKIPTLRVQHAPVRCGSANFLNGMRWLVAGQSRLAGQPYWRSMMGYMCEMRTEIKTHWGVCASLLGRDADGGVRLSGLTILPPPGQVSGSIAIFAFLSGPFTVQLLREGRGYCGAHLAFRDAPADAKPIVITFAPGLLMDSDISAINDFRNALNGLMQRPDASASRSVKLECDRLQSLIERLRRESSNHFFPDASSGIQGAVPVDFVPPVAGAYELFQVRGTQYVAKALPTTQVEVAVSNDGTRLEACPRFLAELPPQAITDLEIDMITLRSRFDLSSARVERRSGVAVVVEGGPQQIVAARGDFEAILEFYREQVEWSLSEMPMASVEGGTGASGDIASRESTPAWTGGTSEKSFARYQSAHTERETGWMQADSHNSWTQPAGKGKASGRGKDGKGKKSGRREDRWDKQQPEVNKVPSAVRALESQAKPQSGSTQTWSQSDWGPAAGNSQARQQQVVPSAVRALEQKGGSRGTYDWSANRGSTSFQHDAGWRGEASAESEVGGAWGGTQSTASSRRRVQPKVSTGPGAVAPDQDQAWAAPKADDYGGWGLPPTCPAQGWGSESVVGLGEALRAANLDHVHEVVEKWCLQYGFYSVADIGDSVGQLVRDMSGLKALEQRRLEKALKDAGVQTWRS